ncbi:MAG: molybdopterin molybdotransferase MoeA [Isosphaeraceae bacterium]|nr:molybdopterin molybdotransferase MoeA [Isosphaeraceae bacterium]
MRGFRTRRSVEEVVGWIDARVGPLGVEGTDLLEAAGRVLAEEVRAGGAVPPFDRAAMDGYAVRGEETFGSDPYNPALFRLVGRSRPGQPFAGTVGPGEAVLIATGAPLPEGADAVVRVEATQADGETIQVVEPTPPGRHVGRRGEDIATGTAVLPAGRVLRPQDLGVLSALGLRTVPVLRRPVVAILITGDELLPPGTPAHAHRIADMNSPMLAALVARDGGRPRIIGPLADDREGLRAAIRDAAASADALLISGGSSTGPEDHAPTLVAELGELAAHGVALRPASPTGLGFLGRLPVVLLPGNPVSCLCAYDFFAGRVVRRLAGRPPDWPYRAAVLPLAQKLASALGRVDYARVRIVEGRVEPLAISGASILSSTTRADGFVVIPADLEGYPPGERVTVWLYDQ